MISEKDIVQDIAETLVTFCMPRVCYSDALVFAKEIYDTEVLPLLRDTWADGHRAHPTDKNPHEHG